MSDLESFIPSEQSEGLSAAAFEKFKEQIKKSAQAAARDAKREQRRRKKEQNLVDILLKLIKQNKRQSLMYLISKLLAEDIPSLFILGICSLGFIEIRREAGITDSKEVSGESLSQSFSANSEFKDAVLTDEVKLELDAWARGIYEAGEEEASQILAKSLTHEGAIKQIVVDCAANVLNGFFDDNSDLSVPYDNFFEFSKFLMKDIFKKLKIAASRNLLKDPDVE